MKKKIVIMLGILIVSILMIRTDYHLAKEEKQPIFAKKTTMAKDGGTIEYLGLGYKVTDYNKIDGRQDIEFSTLLTE